MFDASVESIALFVEGTFLPSREGATRRFVGMARHLSNRGLPIVVIHCYRGWSDLSLIARQSFTTYAMSPTIYYGDTQALCRILAMHNVQLCVYAEAETVTRVGVPLRTVLPGIRHCYECHDVYHTFYSSLGASSEIVEAASMTQRNALLTVDHVNCFTQADKDALMEIRGGHSVALVPFGVDLPAVNYSLSDGVDGTVGLVGNFFHRPNQLALVDTVERIAPSILNWGGKVKVIGHVPQALLERYAVGPLQFCGPVDDLHSLLSTMSVAIAPIRAGSGIKVKILDYLATARPVVATFAAMPGIPRDSCICVENLDEFSSQIIALLTSAAARRDLRLSSYRAAQTMAWPVIAPLLVDVFKTAMKQSVRSVNQKSTPKIEIPYFLTDYGQQKRFDPPPFTPFSDERILRLGGGISEEISA